METGTVVWFNEKQGFGFIARDSGGDKLFFHFSGEGALAVGRRVTFETERYPGTGRLIAVHIRAAD